MVLIFSTLGIYERCLSGELSPCSIINNVKKISNYLTLFYCAGINMEEINGKNNVGVYVGNGIFDSDEMLLHNNKTITGLKLLG